MGNPVGKGKTLQKKSSQSFEDRAVMSDRPNVARGLPVPDKGIYILLLLGKHVFPFLSMRETDSLIKSIQRFCMKVDSS